jgi:hypothetical protein
MLLQEKGLTEMMMNKKQLFFLLTILILTGLLTSPLLIVRAAPPYQSETVDESTNVLTNQDIEPEGDNPTPLTDGMFTYLEPPYFSDDGNSLHNANLPRILIFDPNPDVQDLRYPQDPDIAAEIAGTRSTGATFTITYKASGTTDKWGEPCTTFPTNARAAFDAAAAIWASRIQSSVPITISACWANTLPTGVLGYSGGGSWHRNFSGAPMTSTWYQAALANSFAGTDLNTSNADMHITYSASFNWYFGTDGKTPSGQVDLVTVAAHEIAHGLHFSGTAYYSGGIGEIGFGSPRNPSIYDRFIEDGAGNKLISYSNPSSDLGNALRSNNLWWNGTYANAGNGGGRVKMYAPSTWSSGSSYSHLDYNTFVGTINSLMVFAIGSGSSQHNPGPVTMGILKDMGWQEPVSGPHQLTVSKIGAGTGTVTSVPAGINCGSTCSALFNHGTEVTLSAMPSGGSTFAGWSGSGCSGTGTCQVAMTQARTVSAFFMLQGVELRKIYLPLITMSTTSTDALVNSRFEQGSVGWTQYFNNGWNFILQQNETPLTDYSGSWLAWLDGEDN